MKYSFVLAYLVLFAIAIAMARFPFPSMARRSSRAEASGGDHEDTGRAGRFAASLASNGLHRN